MAQRSIRQAEAVLDSLALSPNDRARLVEEINLAKRPFRQKLDEEQRSSWRRINAATAGVKDEFTRVAAELRALGAEGTSGPLSAREYAERFRQLERQRSDLRERTDVLDHQIDGYQAIEDDPDGWIESLHQRFPTLR